jgi:hypothetical protein
VIVSGTLTKRIPSSSGVEGSGGGRANKARVVTDSDVSERRLGRVKERVQKAQHRLASCDKAIVDEYNDTGKGRGRGRRPRNRHSNVVVHDLVVEPLHRNIGDCTPSLVERPGEVPWERVEEARNGPLLVLWRLLLQFRACHIKLITPRTGKRTENPPPLKLAAFSGIPTVAPTAVTQGQVGGNSGRTSIAWSARGGEEALNWALTIVL